MSEDAELAAAELSRLRSQLPQLFDDEETSNPEFVTPPVHPTTSTFAEMVFRWRWEGKSWDAAFSAWLWAARTRKDRPAPVDLLRSAWQHEADRLLLASVSPYRESLATLNGLKLWESTARWLLKEYTAGDRKLIDISFLLLRSVPATMAQGVTAPVHGFWAVNRMEVPQAWLELNIEEEFGWGTFSSAFSWLCEDRPLTPSEQSLLSRIAIGFVYEPVGTCNGMLAGIVRSAVQVTWDAMRVMIRLAPLPLRPPIPDQPTDRFIDEVFDVVLNWLREAAANLKAAIREDDRERRETEPVRVVQTNIDEAAEANAIALSRLTNILKPDEPRQNRVKCDRRDQSIYLDGKKFAGPLEQDVFGFFSAITEAWPQHVTFNAIAEKVPALKGKNKSVFTTSRVLKNAVFFSVRHCSS